VKTESKEQIYLIFAEAHPIFCKGNKKR